MKGAILAAGGIVLRHGARPLIAIVQRRKDGRWVLPKGKLKPRENPKAGAKREAVEETGQHVDVHEFLGAVTYESGGKPKVTHYWRMQARDNAPRELMRDIKAVEWLSLNDAIEQLSQPIERSFLGEVGRIAFRAARTGHVAPKRRKAGHRSLRARRKRAPRRKAAASHKRAASRANLLGRIFHGL
ncbi:MAG: NUDIX domain-containing protein, partial [Pseudolabrys sp.]|nr:NUDIX domain-containing protein [Pseudolabrys sp.]